jgi:hypothetical protein
MIPFGDEEKPHEFPPADHHGWLHVRCHALRFETQRSARKPHAAPGQNCVALHADSQGRLWVLDDGNATQGPTLFVFDILTGTLLRRALFVERVAPLVRAAALSACAVARQGGTRDGIAGRRARALSWAWR